MYQNAEPKASQGRPYRCLIADDSVFARRNLARVVESVGGTVVAEASNGREAVEKYFELKPDLVLMDISMPEMEGLEALTRIKERDGKARVIIVSALGHKDLVSKGISLGARHFILKPFQAEKAALVIKFVLRQGDDK